MRKACSLAWLSALLLATPAAAAQKSGSQKKIEKGPAAAVRAPQGKAAVTTEDLPAAAGMSLRQGDDGVRVQRVIDGSAADALDLREGDTLLYLNGKLVKTPADAAVALDAWPPGTRLSAVAQRGLRVVRLATRSGRPEQPAVRSPAELTVRERLSQKKHLKAASRAERVPVSAPPFIVSVGEKIWVRFPQGIPKTVEAGAVLEGLAAASMSTDRKLDFIAIPQESRLWAQVVSVLDDEEGLVRMVKLHIFKLELKGGHTYACSAIPVGVSGKQTLLRVSPGGTLVAASVVDSPYLAEPERNIQIRFLNPVSLYEPPEFYRAGPGLWLKSGGDGTKKWFTVSHIIPNRSADRAGIAVGDKVTHINGVPANRLAFTTAIHDLYGEAGTTVRVEVQRAKDRRTDKISLTRAAIYRQGLGLRARPVHGAVTVAAVHDGSPADRAGVRKGDRLLQIGSKKLDGLDRGELEELLARDLKGDDALILQTPGKDMRTLEIQRDWFPTIVVFEPGRGKDGRKVKTAVKDAERPAVSRPRRDGRRKRLGH